MPPRSHDALGPGGRSDADRVTARLYKDQYHKTFQTADLAAQTELDLEVDEVGYPLIFASLRHHDGLYHLFTS